MTTTLPEWFATRQEAARTRYRSIPTPKRGDEAWRFSNLKQLDFEGFERGEETSSELVDELKSRSEGLERTAAKMVFVNERLVGFDSNLPDKVVCLPLAEAIVSHGELVENHFMKQETRLGSAKYAAWHEAMVSNGLFVHVPDHVELDGAIEVHHWISGANTVIFPHTLVVAGVSSKVRVIEVFRSADDVSRGLAVAFNDLSSGPGAKVDHVAIQAFNEVTRVVHINESSTASDATLKSFLLNTGASWARNECLSRLEGRGLTRTCCLSPCQPPSRYTTNALFNITCLPERIRICFTRIRYMTIPRRFFPG